MNSTMRRCAFFCASSGFDRLVVQEQDDGCLVFHLPSAKGMKRMWFKETFEIVVERCLVTGWIRQTTPPSYLAAREEQRKKDQAWTPPVRPPKKTGFKNLEVAKDDSFSIDDLPEAPR